MGRGVLAEPEPDRRPFSPRVRLDERFPEFGRDFEIATSLAISVEAYWRRSPDERAWHEAQWLERKQRCGHCNRPRSECSDPEKSWFPHREVCYATMERSAADAAYARLHEARPWHDGTFQKWSEHPSVEHPYRYDFGVTIGMADSDLRPWDRFLTEDSASPVGGASSDDDLDYDIESGEGRPPPEAATSDGGLATTEEG